MFNLFFCLSGFDLDVGLTWMVQDSLFERPSDKCKLKLKNNYAAWVLLLEEGEYQQQVTDPPNINKEWFTFRFPFVDISSVIFEIKNINIWRKDIN